MRVAENTVSFRKVKHKSENAAKSAFFRDFYAEGPCGDGRGD